MEKFTPPKEPYYGTANGLDIELNLPREGWMQDWPIEVIKAEHLPMLVEHYEKVSEPEKKYVLMLAMIEAIRMTMSENLPGLVVWWERMKGFLEKDYKIHEYHVYHWIRYVAKGEFYKQFPLDIITRDMKAIHKVNRALEG